MQLTVLGFTNLIGQSYIVNVDTSGTYTYLQNPTLISNDEYWFGDDWEIPIGFDFVFYDSVFDSVVVWQGSFYFNDDMYIDGYGVPLADIAWVGDMPWLSLSPISYETIEVNGYKTTKVEYRNAGFNDGTVEDSINFQVWLNEKDNSIEIHIGPNSVDPSVYSVQGWLGPYMGLNNHLTEEYYLLNGNPLNPYVQNIYSLDEGLIGTPKDGMIYNFRPFLSSSSWEGAPVAQKVQIYPNPVNSSAKMRGLEDVDISSITIFNECGVKVGELDVNDYKEIEIPELSNGIYMFLVVLKDGEHIMEKIVVQD